MLLKVLSYGKNKKPFRKRIQLRLIGGAAIALLGVIGLCVFFALGLFSEPEHDFMNGFYTGFAGGFLGGGAATVVKCLQYLRNEQSLKAQELKETDERNIFVAARSAQVAFYLLLTAIFVAVTTIGLLPESSLVFATLIIVLFAMLLFWLVAYIICNKLY